MTQLITLDIRIPEQIILSQLVDHQQAVGNTTTYHIVITIAPYQTVAVHDDLHEQALFKTKIEFVLQEKSRLLYRMQVVESKAILIEKELIIRLTGVDAHAEILATCLGTEKQVFKFKTLQDHQAEHATSKVLIKGVLDGESTLYCHSLIYVGRQAQHTVAEQANKNILLSRAARAVSVPTLEVLANDVRCKHGAAVSRLNDEQLFYLQSRGMDVVASRQMLIQAFLN